MKVLITGGAGFIGSHLAASWCAEGAQVVVLDSLRTGYLRNLEGLGVEFINGRVEDREAVMAAAEGVDYVFHLAAIVNVPESLEKPVETEQINVLGTLNVLEAARRHRVRKVVYSSTCAVYGETERPMHRETDLPEPISPYAVTKLAGEHYAAVYARAYGVATAALRYFNVYGPGQDPTSPYAAVVAIFAECARRGAPLRIYGDGMQTRDFIYVSDVVAANRIAAEGGSGVYNVAGGSSLTVNDLAKAIIAVENSSSVIEHAPERLGDVRHSRGDSSRLRALGWQPQVSLAEGLRRTLRGVEPDAARP